MPSKIDRQTHVSNLKFYKCLRYNQSPEEENAIQRVINRRNCRPAYANLSAALKMGEIIHQENTKQSPVIIGINETDYFVSKQALFCFLLRLRYGGQVATKGRV